MNLTALLVGSIALLFIHPSFSEFGPVIGADGHISVPLPISATVLFGIVSTITVGSRILRDGERGNAAVLIFSASAATTVLMAAMWLGLQAGAVSVYSVKKYSYLVVSTSSLSLAYAFRFGPQLDTNGSIYKLLPAVAAVALSTIILARPSIPILYEIIGEQNYAEAAVRTSHPTFQPANTAVMVDGMHPAVRYMISIATFQMPLAQPSTVGLLTGDFDIQNVDYVMVSTKGSACSEKIAASSEYAIVPVRCAAGMK